MEKEKRKQQPRQGSSLFYIAMTLLGCSVCFGCFVFMLVWNNCTWNRWSTPKISVPSSSILTSERLREGSYFKWLSYTYVDSELTESSLVSFFDNQDLDCTSLIRQGNGCSGTGQFWETGFQYSITFQSSDTEQLPTEYAIDLNWNVCPAKLTD